MSMKQLLKTLSKQQIFEWLALSVLLLLLAWTTLRFVQHSWQALWLPYPLDYGEGPLLDQAMRLARFQNIYRVDLTSPPYVIANYPPLFILLQIPFIWLFDPAFWYGRAISSLSSLVTALSLGLTIHVLTRNRLAGVVGGLTLLTIPYLFWSALNRIDSLALMLSLVGLFVIVRWSDKQWGLVLAALFLTAGVYTKQSYGLAAPFAAFVWLLSQHSRYRAFTLMVIIGTLGLGMFVILNVLSDGGFFFSIVTANVNEYNSGWVFRYLSRMARNMPYFLVSSAVFLLLGMKSKIRSWWLVGPYLVGSGVAALTIGKIGSNVNHFFEVSAAFSLIAGTLIAWQHQQRWLRTSLILLLALQIGMLIRWSGSDFVMYQPVQRAEMEELKQIIHEANGPILADEYMGLLVLDNRALYIEPFLLTHLARSGKWDQGPFIQAIRRQEFALILIYPLYADERWTPQMLAQINTSYEQIATLGGTLIYRAKE